MAIITSKPTVTPANIETTYDKVWVRKLVINAGQAGGDAQANVALKLYREVEEEGETVVYESPDAPIRFQLNNVWSTAEYDVDQLAILQPLLDVATFEQRLGLMATALLYMVEKEAQSQDLI